MQLVRKHLNQKTVTCSAWVTSRVCGKDQQACRLSAMEAWTQSGAELLRCWVSVQGEIPAWHCRLVQVILHGLKQEERRDLNEGCTFREIVNIWWRQQLINHFSQKTCTDCWKARKWRVLCYQQTFFFFCLFLFQEQCLTHQGTDSATPDWWTQLRRSFGSIGIWISLEESLASVFRRSWEVEKEQPICFLFLNALQLLEENRLNPSEGHGRNGEPSPGAQVRADRSL